MKKTLFISAILSLTFISTSFSQTRNNGRQGYNNSRVVTEKDKEKAIERYEKESKEKQDKFIQDFLDELGVDAFQKEIIKQNLYAYIEKKQKIYKLGLKSYEFEDEVKKLNETHFLDIQYLISEGTMNEIQKLIKGDNNKKKEKNKKKKK
jgi:hypothetical protein